MKYLVQDALRHDGNDIEIGGTVELSGEAAAALLATNPSVIVPAAADPAQTPMSAEERNAAIVAAIGGLDKSNASLYLKDGITPDTKALSSMLGWPVSAAERDAAVATTTETV